MWAQIVNTIIGIWLMAAPYVFNYSASGTDNCHIIGPVVATFAMAACWEATRGVRKFNIPLGLWLLAAPWILGYTGTLPIVNDMACGAMIIVFGMVKGKIEGRYGGGWKAIWQSGHLHETEPGNN